MFKSLNVLVKGKKLKNGNFLKNLFSFIMQNESKNRIIKHERDTLLDARANGRSHVHTVNSAKSILEESRKTKFL